MKTFCFVFFFSGKVYTSLTHSFSEGGKKNKNKNTLFTHAPNFCRKVDKNELFRGNKKISYIFHIIKQFFSDYEASRKDFLLNSFFDANFTFRVMKHIGSFHGETAHFLFCPHYEAHSKDFFLLWFIV